MYRRNYCDKTTKYLNRYQQKYPFKSPKIQKMGLKNCCLYVCCRCRLCYCRYMDPMLSQKLLYQFCKDFMKSLLQNRIDAR